MSFSFFSFHLPLLVSSSSPFSPSLGLRSPVVNGNLTCAFNAEACAPYEAFLVLHTPLPPVSHTAYFFCQFALHNELIKYLACIPRFKRIALICGSCRASNPNMSPQKTENEPKMSPHSLSDRTCHTLVRLAIKKSLNNGPRLKAERNFN